MRILIMGAEGQVGAFLWRELASRHAVSGTSWAGTDLLPAVDIRDEAAVHEHLRRHRPDHVVLTAAMTQVDRCEDLPMEAEAVNVQGALHVAKACRDLRARLTYFSSDYVFDGRSGPYSETDAPNPRSVYGRTKLAGERAVADTLREFLIIRTTVVFSYLPGSKNFFMQLLEAASQGRTVTVPSDQLGNPTQAENLAQALGELIEGGRTGVYNLVGTTWLARDEFARRVLQALGQDPALVRPVTTAEMGQKASRPLRGGLRTEKVQSVLRTHRLWDLDQALEHTLVQKG